jgi:hypothetical protein
LTTTKDRKMRSEKHQTPEAAELLQTVREATGLPVRDLAMALGLSGEGGGDVVRAMERGARPVTGPIYALLRYMGAAAGVSLPPSDDDPLAQAIDQTRTRLYPKR